MGYHVQDEIGNILGLIEGGAYVSQANSYDAWGTPTETGIAYNNQLKWKALHWEGDVISLYYMRNRWYDYETGRFMSEDPIGLSGGINLYAFAGNDPVNGWDPYGLCPPCNLPPVIITGRRDWPFSTPRDQGWSNNFGKRGGGWMNFTGYGDENWNGGNGPTGAEAEQALRGVWPAMKKRLGNVGECYSGMLSAAGLPAHYKAVRAAGQSVAASLSSRASANASYRYALGNMFNSRPGSAGLGRAAAADATAFRASGYAYGRAAADAYAQEVVSTAVVQSASRDLDFVEYIPGIGAVYGMRHLGACVR